VYKQNEKKTTAIFSSHVRQRSRVRYLFFTSCGLAQSITCGSVSTIQGGGFNNRGMILTLIIRWLRPPLFLLRCPEAMLAIWSERLTKCLYQENTPPAVRLEPVICRLQTRAFYQLSSAGHHSKRTRRCRPRVHRVRLSQLFVC